MRLLLDTHTLLWWWSGDRRLTRKAKQAVASSPTWVSAASVWELSIKSALGKVTTPDDVVAAIDAEGFEHLPISLAHAEQVVSLPHHHKDPFDRMLVAQAMLEGLTLVTHDDQLDPYGIPLIKT